MKTLSPFLARHAALLAINLLFLMVWGFAAFDKFLHGPPAWFQDKFGKTVLGTLPGVTASFWLLAAAELLAFLLAGAALVRGDFLRRRSPPIVLGWAVTWSLFVFLQLGFGLWLTADFAGGAQMFAYFSGTLIALHFILARIGEQVVGPTSDDDDGHRPRPAGEK